MEKNCPSCQGLLRNSDTTGLYCCDCGLIIATYKKISIRELAKTNLTQPEKKRVEGYFEKDENGHLQRFTASGRKRKHWKVYYRNKSRKYLKDHCERCGVTEATLKLMNKKLTIHHKVPLRKAILICEANCETLCEDCHNKHNYEEGLRNSASEKQ